MEVKETLNSLVEINVDLFNKSEMTEIEEKDTLRKMDAINGAIELLLEKDKNEKFAKEKILSLEKSLKTALKALEEKNEEISKLKFYLQAKEQEHEYDVKMIDDVKGKAVELYNEIKVKDEYMKLCVELLYDYDGFYNKETKKGNIEDMASLIDDVVDLLCKGIKSDTTSVVYTGREQGFNILHEKVEPVEIDGLKEE